MAQLAEYEPNVGTICDIYDKAQNKWVLGEIVDIDKQYRVKPNGSDQIVVVNSDDIRPAETTEMTEKEKQIAAMKEVAVFAASKVPVPQQGVYEFLHDLAKKVRDKGMFIAVAVTIYAVLDIHWTIELAFLSLVSCSPSVLWTFIRNHQLAPYRRGGESRAISCHWHCTRTVRR